MDPFITTAAVLSIGSKLFGAGRAHKARKATRQGMRLRARQAELKAFRNRTQIIREARIAKANTIAGAEAMGAGFSSGVAGGTNSLTSQLFGTLNFFDTQLDLDRQVNVQEQRAAKAIGQAQIAGVVGDIAGAYFETKGGWDSIFDSGEI